MVTVEVNLYVLLVSFVVALAVPAIAVYVWPARTQALADEEAFEDADVPGEVRPERAGGRRGDGCRVHRRPVPRPSTRHRDPR